MDDRIPQVSRLWTAIVLGALLVLFAWLLWQEVAGTRAVLAVALLGVTGLLLVMALCAFTTRLTHDGMSQVTLRGRVTIRWCDVRHAELKGFSLHVATDSRRAIVPLACFPDFDAGLEWIMNRLPPNLR